MLPDMKYYQKFGDEKIIFEKEETAKIKRIVDQGRPRHEPTTPSSQG